MFKIVNMGGNFWSDHSLFQSKIITIFQYYRHFNNTFYIWIITKKEHSEINSVYYKIVDIEKFRMD